MKEQQRSINIYKYATDQHYQITVLNSNNLQFYSEYLLAYYCMPTLMRMKPSSLIRINKKRLKQKELFLKFIDTETTQFDCGYLVLFENDEMMNLLIYHKELLYSVLSANDNKKLLQLYGYELQQDIMADTFRILQHKLKIYYDSRTSHDNHDHFECENTGFPHEIGIILGYPRTDVEDFIRYRGRNYLLCGYWKVYHNKEEAVKIFQSYRRIREDTVRLLLEGKKLYDIFPVHN